MKKVIVLVLTLFIGAQVFANDTGLRLAEMKNELLAEVNPSKIKEDIKTVIKEENSVVAEPEEKISMHLDSSTKKQGEFFQVLIRGLKDEPKVWFMTKEYPAFEIADNQEWNSIIGKSSKHMYRALIPVENMTKPGNYSILARSHDGKDIKWEHREQVTIVDNEKPISRITLSSSKSQIYASQKELDTVGKGLKTRSHKKLWLGKFIYPSNAPKSSPFGVKRSYNGGPVDSYHKGLDFAAEKGATVLAPADGKVIAVGKADDGFNVHGNTIILDHGHGVTSIYLHLSKIDVHRAQDVKAGEKIGEVGHTGISTGPHLHWGVYLSGTSVDPELFVKNSVL